MPELRIGPSCRATWRGQACATDRQRASDQQEASNEELTPAAEIGSPKRSPPAPPFPLRTQPSQSQPYLPQSSALVSSVLPLSKNPFLSIYKTAASWINCRAFLEKPLFARPRSTRVRLPLRRSAVRFQKLVWKRQADRRQYARWPEDRGAIAAGSRRQL